MFAQNTLSEQQKIDHLIQYIRSLHGVTFDRNGTAHTPVEAADHLQMKRKKAGSKIKTARDFIEKIASKSSITGKPYLIIFKNGQSITCEAALLNELKKLEKK